VSRPPVSTSAGWRLVAACAVLSATLSAGALARLPRGVAVAALAALGLAAAGARLVSWRARFALLLIACIGAGMLRTAMLASADHTLLDAARSGPVVLLGTVRDGTGARRSASQVVIDAERLVQGDVDRDVHGGVVATLRSSSATVLPGDRVELDATRLRPPRSTGAESLLPREGVEAVAQSPTLSVQARGGPSLPRVLAVARSRLTAVIDAALPEPAAALVDDLVFGGGRPLPADLTQSLRDSGLAHILAVSGLKVVLVAGLISALCAALAASPRTRLLLSAATVGGYVLLCGAGPAAVRSAIMAGGGWSLYGSSRRLDPLPLLAVTATAMLLVDPALCRDVGFQLTFLGTLGILLFAAPLAGHLPGPRLFREPFAVTLGAQLLTLPVMASAFGVVSLVGPLANALAVPLLPPLLGLGLVGSTLGLAVPGLASIPLQGAGLLASAIAALARWSAALLGAAIHVTSWPVVVVALELGAAALGIVLWRVARPFRQRPSSALPHRPSRASALLLAGCLAVPAAGGMVALAFHPDAALRVSVLDVGAATAVAIQTTDGSHALVDAGGDAQHVLDSLGAALPPLARELGLLVLTGGDRTSTGGLAAVLTRYHVGRVVAPGVALTGATRAALGDARRTGTQIDVAPTDAAWTWGGDHWRLLSADSATAPAIALQIASPTAAVLVLGPMPTDAQEELAGTQGTTLRSDLLVAPPSGAIAPALLATVRPQLVAVPSARATRSPSTPLLSGAEVRRTADDGTLTYTTREGGFTAA
jgi:ComEC/Rec2-related protein